MLQARATREPLGHSDLEGRRALLGAAVAAQQQVKLAEEIAHF